MERLVVNLPAIRRSIRKQTQKKSSDVQINKSTERSRKFRETVRNDSEKLQKMKEKKREENRKYKAKIKQKRLLNTAFDAKVKADLRRWQKESHKRQNKREGRTVAKKITTLKQTRKSPKETSKTKAYKSADSIRKRAERASKHLPESPRAWVKTVAHMLKKATPRRKSKLLGDSTDKEKENCESVLNLNKAGRPRKEVSHIKKKLAFSTMNLEVDRKVLNRYKKRKQHQLKTKTKATTYREQWQKKFTEFLEANSRVMPNKKDTILIEGQHVAKRHLLCSKLELFRKFQEDNRTFRRKFTTFLKWIPRNYKCLNLACRRVCVCMKEYNIDEKIQALNKAAQNESLKETVSTARRQSDMTVCDYEGIPARLCVDRKCEHCGVNVIGCSYKQLVEKTDNKIVKYSQWEKASETYKTKKVNCERSKGGYRVTRKSPLRKL